nr:sulfotransferase family 2 domain-containing protein [uncultured Celeribacter sp.]
MPKPFEYFVVFAEMRTGSNFLEENINAYPGLTCWGEAFNPVFIGGAKRTELLGIDMAAREAAPLDLLARMRAETEGLAGFRFFHDHDPRILKHVLSDPACAKIILTRNPLESYVSRKIAGETGQWRLGDLKHAKTTKVPFDKAEFEAHLGTMKAFQLYVQRELQISGQTGFYINYEDIQDVEILNGLARFLGVHDVRDKTRQKTKVQNPAPITDKVSNPEDMLRALSDIDHFNLSNTPNFEPRRGPAVPSYVAAADAPLLYMPIAGGPEGAVTGWLANLDGREVSDLLHGFTQKSLRQWKRQHKGHRSFTVVSHPVVRLHRAYCRHIVAQGPETYGEIREVLRTTYGLPLPLSTSAPGYDLAQHRAGFLKFIHFVAGNLNGQTSLRVDRSWASQSEVIKGFAEFSLPDMILREDRLQADAAYLAQMAGCRENVSPAAEHADQPFALADIYDADIEAQVRAAYQRDYMMFGFQPWQG